MEDGRWTCARISLGEGVYASDGVETLQWNLVGTQSHPAKPSQQPVTSLAWNRGDPGCEA